MRRMLHIAGRFGIVCSAVFGMACSVSGGPLDNWTSVASGTTNHLRAIAFGGGTFVAAGDGGKVLTSSNGITWASQSTGISNALNGVSFGHGQFVAVGSAGLVMTSGDGAAWATQSSGTTKQLNAISATDIGFVAVGN